MGAQQSRVLTRESLFARIWETPITRLSKEYGLSDVGLAKLCRRMEIPRPPRGYWRQLEVGRAPGRPRLRPLSKKGVDRVTIRPQPAREGPTPDLPPPDAISVPEALCSPHRLTQKTLRALEKGKPDERGVIVPRSKFCLYIRVARDNIERACLVMDTLVKALEERGYAPRVVGGSPAETVVDVSDESFRIGIEEVVRCTKHEVTEADRARQRRAFQRGPLWWPPRYDHHPTGRLSLVIHNAPWHCRRSWRDGKRQRIEDCLGAFIQGLEMAAEREKERRAEWERERREAEERARLAREQARLEKLEELRREKITADAAAWAEARRIQAYIAELKRIERPIPGLKPWIEWATAYVARTDPLCSPERVVFQPDLALREAEQRGRYGPYSGW